jgi:hypothetical protein
MPRSIYVYADLDLAYDHDRSCDIHNHMLRYDVYVCISSDACARVITCTWESSSIRGDADFIGFYDATMVDREYKHHN